MSSACLDKENLNKENILSLHFVKGTNGVKMAGLWAQSYSGGIKFATCTLIIQFYTQILPATNLFTTINK